MEAGLVEGEDLSVDGSFVQANASRIPCEQWQEVARVKGTVQQYLTEGESRQETRAEVN